MLTRFFKFKLKLVIFCGICHSIKWGELELTMLNTCICIKYCIYVWCTYIHSINKDTRITRCVTLYDFLVHDFFALALEVAPGFLEFLFESERAERATANSSFLRMSEAVWWKFTSFLLCPLWLSLCLFTGPWPSVLFVVLGWKLRELLWGSFCWPCVKSLLNV